MKTKNHRIPHVNEIWISKWKENKPNYYFMITDIYKKKPDEYKPYDEDFNEAEDGTTFIYGVNEQRNITTTHRGTLEEFLKDYDYYGKAFICTCQYCNKLHFPSNLIMD